MVPQKCEYWPELGSVSNNQPQKSRTSLYEASLHHRSTSSESTLDVSFVYLVYLKYFSTLFNFFKLSLSGSFTPVVRNVCMSLRYLLLISNSCDTVWCNISSLSLSKNLDSYSFLTWNRWSASSVEYVPLNYSGNWSSTFCRYLIIDIFLPLYLRRPNTYSYKYDHFLCVLSFSFRICLTIMWELNDLKWVLVWNLQVIDVSHHRHNLNFYQFVYHTLGHMDLGWKRFFKSITSFRLNIIALRNNLYK